MVEKILYIGSKNIFVGTVISYLGKYLILSIILDIDISI